MKVLIILLMSTFFINAYCSETFFCTDELGTLPIQQNGRVKPLYVHANEVVKELTGQTSVDGKNAVISYCLLSLNGMGLTNDLIFKAKIEHVQIKKILGLGKDEDLMSYKDLLIHYSDLKLEMRSNRDNDSYAKAISKVIRKIDLYNDVVNGMNWTFAELSDGKINWVPLVSFLTETKFKEQVKLTPLDPFTPLLLSSKKVYKNMEGNKFEIEYFYSKLGLVNISLMVTILAIISLVLFRKIKIGITLVFFTIIIQLFLVGFRVYISGRAPITNMYETVLSSGLGGIILASLLAYLQKNKIYYFIGLFYNFCSLMMLIFANGMLSGTISPLVPVLRDNFWLSTHVTTVILSYGALALSWVLSNYVLVKRRFSEFDPEEEYYYSQVVYTILKVGTTMLIAGIILGGVWADYSWGRYWGWDPKETWSLIVFCIYIIILHGRYTQWITTQTFFRWTALAFLSVMMAWFGVNYILATGLHSYGFSEGGALFLGSFFILQICLVLFCEISYNKVKKDIPVKY